MKCASKLIRASIPVWLALTGVAIHSAAQAETRLDEKRFVGSERVSYADLDIDRPEDAQVLMSRIKNAAYRVCGGDPRRHMSYTLIPGRVEAAFKECREDAVAQAMAAVESSM